MKVYITKPGSKRIELNEQEHYIVQDGHIKLYGHYQDLINNKEGYELSVEYEEPVVEAVVPAGESDIMTRDLSTHEQNAIIGPLFGFFADEDGGIVDDEGYSFYAVRSNLEFDLSTLAGIFVYVEYKAMHKGAQIARSEVKKALGL